VTTDAVAANTATFNKNIDVKGLLTSQNDYMIVDPVCPIPSMLMQYTGMIIGGDSLYFNRETLTMHTCLYISTDVSNDNTVIASGRQDIQSTNDGFGYTANIKFTSFELLDVCDPKGAFVRSVAPGYSMSNLEAGEYVRWKVYFDETYLDTSGYADLDVQYGYWHMDLKAVYLNYIKVTTDDKEVVVDQRLFPLFTENKPFSIKIDPESNAVVSFSMTNPTNDTTDPVFLFKYLASYCRDVYSGFNDGTLLTLNASGQSFTHQDKAGFVELYNAMLGGDVWNTKYTNQEVKTYGPRYDTIDTAHYFNQFNVGHAYSDSNWNNYYSNLFIETVNTTNVATGGDSNLYYLGPTTGLDNYLTIQMPTNNNCFGPSNLSNATAFVSAHPEIIPSRPVMHVRSGMSYYELCECVSFLTNRFNGAHFECYMYAYEDMNTSMYSQVLAPPYKGSVFIQPNGKYTVPYSFSQIVNDSPSYSIKVNERMLSAFTSFSNQNTPGAIGGAIFGLSVYNIPETNESAVPIVPSMAFISNVHICCHYYTDPIMYTSYAYNIVKTALNQGEPRILCDYYSWANEQYASVQQQWDLFSSNALYQQSLTYMVSASWLGIQNLTVNGNAVPYSANLASVSGVYRANTVPSDLFTFIDYKVLPIRTASDPDDFGPAYQFSYYIRHGDGSGWSEVDWVNGMTASLASYRTTLADTYFVKTILPTIDDEFGVIDKAYASSEAGITVTSNVGYISRCACGQPGTGLWFTPNGAALYDPALGYTAPSANTLVASVLSCFWTQCWWDGVGVNGAPLATYRIYKFLKDVLKVDQTIILDERDNLGGDNFYHTMQVRWFSRSRNNDTLTQEKKTYIFENSGTISGEPKYTRTDTALTSFGSSGETNEYEYGTANVYRSDVAYYFQGPGSSAPTRFMVDDQIKLVTIFNQLTSSGGEYSVSGNGLLGTRGNVHAVRLGFTTVGAMSGYNYPQSPLYSLIPAMRQTYPSFALQSDGKVLYASGLSGTESIAYNGSSNLTPGVNKVFKGTYSNPAADTGLRTGWQDAGYDVSNAQTFWSGGVKYTSPGAPPYVDSIKTQGWRDCELERALVFNENTTLEQSSNIAYITANKSTLLEFPPY